MLQRAASGMLPERTAQHLVEQRALSRTNQERSINVPCEYGLEIHFWLTATWLERQSWVKGGCV